jgi:hypothetical protein
MSVPSFISTFSKCASTLAASLVSAPSSGSLGDSPETAASASSGRWSSAPSPALSGSAARLGIWDSAGSAIAALPVRGRGSDFVTLGRSASFVTVTGRSSSECGCDAGFTANGELSTGTGKSSPPSSTTVVSVSGAASLMGVSSGRRRELSTGMGSSISTIVG